MCVCVCVCVCACVCVCVRVRVCVCVCVRVDVVKETEGTDVDKMSSQTVVPRPWIMIKHSIPSFARHILNVDLRDNIPCSVLTKRILTG